MQLKGLFANKEAMADPAALMPAVTQLLRGSLGGNDAKSLKSIAGLANHYRDASVGHVDVDTLLDGLMEKMGSNPALANAIFGGKNGSKIFAAFSDPDLFKKLLNELRNESQGYAAGVSEKRIAGFDGALSMLSGSMLNLQGAFGRAFDNDGRGGFLTDVTRAAAGLTQALAEADPAVLRMAGTAGAAVAAFAGMKALGWIGGGFGLNTAATALEGSAAALDAAAARLIAQSKDQAEEVFNYVKGAFEQSTALRGLIEGETERTLSLRTRIDVQVRALSFRNLRGATNIAVIGDEVAYWRSDESANPDVEIIGALRPSLATTKGPLIAISSPYAKKGILWTAFVRDSGPEGRPGRLVAKAPTTTMNPDIDPDFLTDAYADDPVAAAAEYGAECRDDISAFISADVVGRITVQNRTEIPPEAGVVYAAFMDVGGGTGGDSYTAAIAHARPMEGSGESCAVLDFLFEVRPPYSPDEVTATLCETLKRYRISAVTGDNYGGAWPRERFAHHGVKYEPASKQNIAQLLNPSDSKTGPLYASEIYRTFLALANAGRVELLDHAKMRTQLLTLERRTTPSGNDSITHPKGGHDDCINAAAGACVIAAHGTRRMPDWGAIMDAKQPGWRESMAHRRIMAGFNSIPKPW